MHPEDIEERRQRFDYLWRARFIDTVCRLPAHHQGAMYDLLRNAYNTGTNDERRKHEPVQIGGMD